MSLQQLEAKLALAKSLGNELAGHNISVNTDTLAVTKTTLALSQDPEFLKMVLSKVSREECLNNQKPF